MGQNVTAIENGASYIAQGLPNAGIAQGSIFVVMGTNLGPSPIVIDPVPFESTNLSGTSVSVTVGTTTVNAPMYYTSAAQVAALLPSNTPVGSGTLTVTYNNSTSTAVGVSIVQNTFGIFTLSSSGAGAAILTYQDYSIVSAVPGIGSLAPCTPTITTTTVCQDTYRGAANPGDVLTLWGTGLGPVSGGDSSASLGQPVSTPLTLWIGGVSVPVSFQGRGCCIGEDQINFTVPNNVPKGCAVPIAVQMGINVSNFALVPIAQQGSRSCTPQESVLAGTPAQEFTTSSVPINYGAFSMGRSIASLTTSGLNYQDTGAGEFGQVSVLPINQPSILTLLDNPPLGTCTTSAAQVAAAPPFSFVGGLDAGTVTVAGPPPSVPVAMTEKKNNVPTSYSANFSPNGQLYFFLGQYQVVAAGGGQVGAFNIPFTITQTPNWTNGDQTRLGMGVTRANGMTLNWTVGSSAYYVQISGTSAAASLEGPNEAVSASFTCWVNSSLGTFNVPASVLLALPGAINTEIDFKPTLPTLSFSAPGMDFGFLSFQYQTSYFVPFK